MKTLLLILLLTIPVFPCGAPTAIAGQVDSFTPSVLTIENRDGEILEQTRSSHFGYFYFSTSFLACDAPMTIRVRHKYLLFESSVIEAKEFDGFIFRFIDRMKQ